MILSASTFRRAFVTTTRYVQQNKAANKSLWPVVAAQQQWRAYHSSPSTKQATTVDPTFTDPS